MNQPISALIFDCDGTLADTMPLHFLAWQSTLARYGFTFDEDHFYSLAGQPTDKIVEQLARQQSISVDAVQVSHEKEQAFLERIGDVQPIQPIVDVALEHRGTMPMGVGSGGMRDVVQQILDVIGLGDVFDCVVGSEDTELHKPEPDVFLEVARRLKVEPGVCRVYEDADLGVEAARRAGMECFDVRTIYTPQRMT